MRALLLLLLAACGSDPCPDGSMFASAGGLEVTRGEHGEGWGQADCQACHPLVRTHDWVCTAGIDGPALRELVAAEGYEVCSDCHGDNGVSQ